MSITANSVDYDAIMVSVATKIAASLVPPSPMEKAITKMVEKQASAMDSRSLTDRRDEAVRDYMSKNPNADIADAMAYVDWLFKA